MFRRGPVKRGPEIAKILCRERATRRVAVPGDLRRRTERQRQTMKIAHCLPLQRTRSLRAYRSGVPVLTSRGGDAAYPALQPFLGCVELPWDDSRLGGLPQRQEVLRQCLIGR